MARRHPGTAVRKREKQGGKKRAGARGGGGGRGQRKKARVRTELRLRMLENNRLASSKVRRSREGEDFSQGKRRHSGRGLEWRLEETELTRLLEQQKAVKTMQRSLKVSARKRKAESAMRKEPTKDPTAKENGAQNPWENGEGGAVKKSEHGESKKTKQERKLMGQANDLHHISSGNR